LKEKVRGAQRPQVYRREGKVMAKALDFRPTSGKKGNLETTTTATAFTGNAGRKEETT
jgi:hypothetical protein